MLTKVFSQLYLTNLPTITYKFSHSPISLCSICSSLYFHPQMGIQKSNRHKRTKTGGKRGIAHKKRKHALARPPSNTRIGETRVRKVRTRGGNIKHRALRLNNGTFKISNKEYECKIAQVMYHPTNTELMRTNTLTKSSVVKIENEDLIKYVKSIGEEKDELLVSLAEKGLVYGVVVSRPGQEGCVLGRVLQDKELQFYVERFKKNKLQ